MRVTPSLSLSANFTLAEFTRSETARKHQLYNLPRDVSEVANLKALCDAVLEPVRALFGRPVIITSGYRCVTLNRLIGGAVGSQHLYGEAADIVVAGLKSEDVARTLAAHPDLPFDQVIYEAHERADGSVARWVHISHKRLGPNRREALTILIKNGQKRTLQGIQSADAAETMEA